MGRGWVNAVREAAGAKKGKAFTKISKEITVAVKLGGANPEGNARLKSALRDAQKNSMPKDTIDRAIKRGEGGGDGAQLEEAVFEGYGPHGVAALIEVVTDNRNRSVQELRATFARNDGKFGEAGSVAWMFDRIGSIVAKTTQSGVDAESVAIEAGADDVQPLEDGQFHFITKYEDMYGVSDALQKAGWEILASHLGYKAKTPAELTPEQEKDVQDFVSAIEDIDDVKRVHLAL